MEYKLVLGNNVFECYRDMIEVTSHHRPDTTWRFVDARDHEHRWYEGDRPARYYDPSLSYDTPTLIWVKDGEEYWQDDDEPHEVGHLECRQCGEHVNPGYKADDTRQYVAGIFHGRINGVFVSKEEFETRLAAARESAESRG